MADQRPKEPVIFFCLRRKATDESVFVTGVDLLVHEAEAHNKSVVTLSLHRAGRVEHLLRWISYDLHLVILVLEELVVERSGYVDLL